MYEALYLTFVVHLKLQQNAVGKGRVRPKCRHLANWTKHMRRLILAHSLHYVKT